MYSAGADSEDPWVIGDGGDVVVAGAGAWSGVRSWLLLFEVCNYYNSL